MFDTNKNIDTYINELELEIENETDNKYVIKISDEQKAHKLLNKVIAEGISVNKFEIKKPTLNDIFIEKVGEWFERNKNHSYLWVSREILERSEI